MGACWGILVLGVDESAMVKPPTVAARTEAIETETGEDAVVVMANRRRCQVSRREDLGEHGAVK